MRTKEADLLNFSGVKARWFREVPNVVEAATINQPPKVLRQKTPIPEGDVPRMTRTHDTSQMYHPGTNDVPHAGSANGYGRSESLPSRLSTRIDKRYRCLRVAGHPERNRIVSDSRHRW